MGDTGGLLKFIMVVGSAITAILTGTHFQAALIQAVYHIQNYSADETEYYTSSRGANAMQFTTESEQLATPSEHSVASSSSLSKSEDTDRFPSD